MRRLLYLSFLSRSRLDKWLTDSHILRGGGRARSLAGINGTMNTQAVPLWRDYYHVNSFRVLFLNHKVVSL